MAKYAYAPLSIVSNVVGVFCLVQPLVALEALRIGCLL